jgi:GT2 family glycosyltransferase
LLFSAIGGARFLNGALSEAADRPAEVETLCGAFMLVRTDAWRQVKGFDTSFFMYSEELDLCVRLRQCGWGIMMTPRAEIVHLVGSGQSQSARRIQLLTTGRMHFFRKFWSRPRAMLGGIILWLHGLIRVVLATLAGPLLGRERAQNLRQAYIGVVLQPGAWWYGFNRACRD